ncbi:MAG: TetR/AcrR family transcriptional regulator [Proteobacteria bacterium]|nr:TetR/AcrR family transcriptional regulator [Pseudomonadota bacterium]
MVIQDIDIKISQQEKSQLMKKRLIEATLDCLQLYGFHGASLSRILDRAGVSRGAWRHHYESKNDLVASASECLLSTALSSARDIAKDLSAEATGIADILEMIWEKFYQGRYRDVWVEFNVACRTDKELYHRLSPVIRSFFDEMDRIWNNHLNHLSRPGLKAETIMNLSLYLLRGLSFQSVSQDRPDHFRDMRERWVALVMKLMAS